MGPPSRPHPPRLLAVADPGAAPADAGAGFGDGCAALAAAGIDGLLLRDLELSDRLRLRRAAAARAAFPGLLLLRARLDLALASGADGVHLPAEGVPLAALRAVAPAELLCGRATHTVDEVARARDEGCDYAIFGPVFATPSKAGRIEPRGISSLADAVATGLPVIAIGGIDGGNAAAVAAAGAWGIAAIRLFAEPLRDAGELRRLVKLWEGASAG